MWVMRRKKNLWMWRDGPLRHATPHKLTQQISSSPPTMTSAFRPTAHTPHDVDVNDDDDFDVDNVDWDSAARDIQNRVSRVVGTAGREARHFREFFGASVGAVEAVWDRLVHHGLLPEKGRPKHLLWALYFLKVYPKQGPGCSVVGGCAGAVDPKTFRKWVWAFIKAIAELEEVVVSIFFNILTM